MATLVRWTPLREIEAMERRVRRMFDEAGFAGQGLPAADIFERGDEYVVEIEVPGFDENELTVEVTDHTLCVKGARSESKEQEEKSFQLKERLERSFERRFLLPEEADLEQLTATYAKGVLEIHAPKAQSAEPRTISIEKG